MKKIIFLLLLFLTSTPALAQTDVIKEVFFNLNKDYINETNNKDMTVKGLQSLTKIDPNIRVYERANKLFLYQGDKAVKYFEFPSNNEDIDAWADLSKNVISEATKVSEKLDVLDFELPDRFAADVFEGLDGYSHYFGAFEDVDESKPLKFKRPFATRVVDNVLLIRVLSFQKDISERVRTAVEECSKCEGLILDLRGNHGGLLDEAVKIANLFLDEGIIAYTLSAENDPPEYYTAESGDILGGRPMVILTDGYTASAAEVLAAGLSEQNRAVLIGTKTYGKGTVQDVQKMGGERAISMTTSFFYTPSGVKIDKVGLTPFICTSLDEACEKEDRMSKEEDIDRAVKYLKTGM